MPSKKLEDLHPNLLPLVESLLEDLKKENIKFVIDCTYRTNAEQDKLYSRNRPGRIITRARGGQSEHNYTIKGKPASKAIDLYPVIDGKIDGQLDSPLWNKVKAIWKCQKPIDGYYLDWYGRDNSPFKEGAHFCLKKVI